MPVVSATITHRRWHAWDQEHNIKPKSLPQLAEEGLWLMDGLDPARRAVVEAEVPWVPRMIVLHGFGPGYRRRAAVGGRSGWGGGVRAGARVSAWLVRVVSGKEGASGTAICSTAATTAWTGSCSTPTTRWVTTRAGSGPGGDACMVTMSSWTMRT